MEGQPLYPYPDDGHSPRTLFWTDVLHPESWSRGPWMILQYGHIWPVNPRIVPLQHFVLSEPFPLYGKQWQRVVNLGEQLVKGLAELCSTFADERYTEPFNVQQNTYLQEAKSMLIEVSLIDAAKSKDV